jgi:hypothetical protein
MSGGALYVRFAAWTVRCMLARANTVMHSKMQQHAVCQLCMTQWPTAVHFMVLVGHQQADTDTYARTLASM